MTIACDLVHGGESESGGIKTVLTEYAPADGGVIWDGSSDIVVRRATDAEHERWQQSRDAAYEDDKDEPDDWDVFLIPISDPLADDEEDDDTDPQPHGSVVQFRSAKKR